MHALVLNSGSSSLKFGLYYVHQDRMACLLDGEAENIGSGDSIFRASDSKKRIEIRETLALISQHAAVIRIARLLDDERIPSPDAIGHRVVHGGPRLSQHCVVKDDVFRMLEAANIFAPLHMPAALDVIRYATEHFPKLPQVVCLDTSFHAHMPAVARTLPLPLAMRSTGLQRYGFHGLSCESIVHQLGLASPARLIIAHLGSGASITAVLNGVSIDNSMGLTPSGGLVMSTRCGDLDPGVVVHLMREMGMDAPAIEELTNLRGGLLGVSGVSGDMRSLHEATSVNSGAKLAIAMFCYRVAKEISAMCSVMNGLDLIVFTGGIGERDALVRADVCSRLTFLGVELEIERNGIGRDVISADTSRVYVRVLPSREDAQIALHTYRLCGLAAES